jgi:hypothetical protein
VREDRRRTVGTVNILGPQAVIDDAVNAYRQGVRDAVPNYARAVNDAEQHLAGRPGNVTPPHDR